MIFWLPFGEHFLTFGGFGGQVGSGSEEFEKRDPQTQKKVYLPHKICVLRQTIFNDFFEVCLDSLLPIWVAKVSQMRDPWDHFSKHVAGKLEW